MWVEPPEKKMVQKKATVIYYLTRNGQLQQPHFMEVPLSSSRGLFLKDVVTQLNFKRGEGMASMYSWSCKRSYGNGFVWQDLSDNEFIYPTSGHDYVLKGSELLHLLLDGPPILKHTSETGSSSSSSDIQDSSKEVDSPVVVTRRSNQSCSSVDLYDYKVYKITANSVSLGESVAANASTQTDSRRRVICEKEDAKKVEVNIVEHQTVEVSRGEISSPPSDSSPETLKTLMKVDKRLMLQTGALNGNFQDHTAGISLNSNSKMKVSSVLLQLISCGSFPFKDCGASAVKDHGLSLVSSFKSKLPRETSSSLKLEEKEYFSGSLIETRRESDDELTKLKRSFSCNADRKSRLRLTEMRKGGTNNHQ